MRRGAVVLAIAAGALAGRAAITWWPSAADAPAAIVPDNAGAIGQVVMHYHPAAAQAVVPIYARLLTNLDRQADVVWVVAGQADADDLRNRLGEHWPARSRTVVIGKPISTWSKDRCLPLSAGETTRLLAPRRLVSANPLRTNDGETPWQLARQWPQRFACRQLPLDFDGGDFYATPGRVFAHVALLAKNGIHARDPAAVERLRAMLERELGRPTVWLGEPAHPDAAPPHHVGMFLTVVGDRAIVGDVRLAESAVAPDAVRSLLSPAGGPLAGPDRERLIAALDATADQMARLGYHVGRVPLLAPARPRAWISYNNGVLDEQGGEVVMLMPTFGQPTLDALAARQFAGAGCRVVEVDCSAVWPLGGTLRCLTNVTGRRGLD